MRLDLPGLGIRTLEGDLAVSPPIVCKSVLKWFGRFQPYKELRYINVSNNDLNSIETLSHLPELLSINAQHNRIQHGTRERSTVVVASRPFCSFAAKLGRLQNLQLLELGS